MADNDFKIKPIDFSLLAKRFAQYWPDYSFIILPNHIRE